MKNKFQLKNENVADKAQALKDALSNQLGQQVDSLFIVGVVNKELDGEGLIFLVGHIEPGSPEFPMRKLVKWSLANIVKDLAELGDAIDE